MFKIECAINAKAHETLQNEYDKKITCNTTIKCIAKDLKANMFVSKSRVKIV